MLGARGKVATGANPLAKWLDGWEALSRWLGGPQCHNVSDVIVSWCQRYHSVSNYNSGIVSAMSQRLSVFIVIASAMS